MRSPRKGNRIEVQGHRGCRGLVPENTLPAFERALDLRVDAIELDLHLSRDGHVLVTHDPYPLPSICRSIEVLPAYPPPYGELELERIQSTYIADLNPNPRAFPRQDPGFCGLISPRLMRQAASVFSPPTLVQVFELIDHYGVVHPQAKAYTDRVRLELEIKRPLHTTLGPYAGQFEERVSSLVQAWRQTVVSVRSFSTRTLHLFKPSTSLEKALLTQDACLDPVAQTRSAGARVWSPHYRTLTRSLVAEVRHNGLQVVPWTVNEPEEMRILLSWQVDGIITDVPDTLISLLN
ncbi:MAG: hypothetical protein H7Y22_18815 [Gemmatimonadaceae bacterium]|nr:hypothetical protein [Gloeobacterales cyanobacterium ES-bin-141]